MINLFPIIDSFTDSFVHILESMHDKNEIRDSLFFMTFIWVNENNKKAQNSLKYFLD